MHSSGDGLIQAKGDTFRAMELGKQYRDPNVDLLVKAAVAPGTTLDPAWAKPSCRSMRLRANLSR